MPATTCSVTVSDWIELAGVVATLVLAAVAIWGDPIRAYLIGPRLQLRLLNPHGERQDTNNGPARFYHLEVSNSRRGFAPARNVRVMLTAIARPDANGKLQWIPLSGPIQFTWQHGHLLAQFLTIGPPANADLANVLKQGMFDLSLYFRPIGFQTFLGGAKRVMVIEVRAQSDEAESDPLRVRIAWDGQWSEDTAEMARHLVVEEVAD